MTDYSKTIMYKIVCNDLNVKECYVGHTINMTKRKCCHKSACNNEKDKGYNNKIYQIIRENGGWSNWSMILVEKFPCEDKHEACKKEREIVEELAEQKSKLYRYLAEEDLKEYDKKYYHINEKLNEKIECEYCYKQISKCIMYQHIKTCKCKDM